MSDDTTTPSTPGQQEANIALQERFGAAVNEGNLDLLVDLVSASNVDHDPAPGQVPGPQGYKDFFGEMRTAFPDLGIAVDHLVADENNVSFAYTLTGTHDGPFQGHEATGKKISVRGLQISRFEDGKMVERWGSSDELGILKQLGLFPTS
ncbi:MAG: hypothetical protein JWQ43_485 [Glaciihabitans sp.]|nr:hypothetical protein [Glaciihabitans sp.]